MTTQDLDIVKREERTWQEQHGGSLQQRAYERPGTQVVLEGQFARVAGALALGSGMRVLDLGCGVGYLLNWLGKSIPAQYHGLDLSLNSLCTARRENPALRLAVGDAESLPYEDGSFDRIVCNGTAHHFLAERAAFCEMYRVLAPGGILVLYEPTSTPLTSALRSLLLSNSKAESPADLAHKEEFTPARAQALLLDAGFANTSVSYHDFLAYPLSGNYLGSPLSRWRFMMLLLWGLENGLARLAWLRPILDLFSWRLLVVSTKPLNTQPA